MNKNTNLFTYITISFSCCTCDIFQKIVYFRVLLLTVLQPVKGDMTPFNILHDINASINEQQSMNAGHLAMHACQIGPVDTASLCLRSPHQACVRTREKRLEVGNLFAPISSPVRMVRLQFSLFFWILGLSWLHTICEKTAMQMTCNTQEKGRT